MECCNCFKIIPINKQCFTCYHCGELGCYACGEKIFNKCPGCKNSKNQKVDKLNLIKVMEKNPYHKNRAVIFYKIASLKTNPVEKFHWHNKAAKAGFPFSMDYIGYSYLKGYPETEGIDYKKALIWLTLATENKFKASFFELGKMYEEGLGVEIDVYRANTIFVYGGMLGNEKCRKHIEKKLLSTIKN